MKLIASCLLLIVSDLALAQDYGLLVGVHESTASSDRPGASASGVLNFDLGLSMGFELLPGIHFKTGAIYNERHIDYNLNTGGTMTYNFAYIDVPVDAQYNFTDMLGIYGGLIVGINVNDNVHAPRGTPSFDPGAKALYPLLNVGVDLMFNNMLGFDFYYEFGLGDYANAVKNLNSFGLNFTYWF